MPCWLQNLFVRFCRRVEPKVSADFVLHAHDADAIEIGQKRERTEDSENKVTVAGDFRRHRLYAIGFCPHGIGIVGGWRWRLRRWSIGRSRNHFTKRTSCLTASS